MRYLLDTNVISDRTRPRPDSAVAAWMGALSPGDVALSTITVGEIQTGVLKLAHGARRTFLSRWLDGISHQFDGRVLPVNVPVARMWGRLMDEARRTGRAMTVPDALLLATAVVHALVLVTRNERDFRDRGADILNPWTSR